MNANEFADTLQEMMDKWNTLKSWDTTKLLQFIQETEHDSALSIQRGWALSILTKRTA